MAFYDTIEKLKKEMTDYSAEEGRLTELYKSALENAKNRYNASKEGLDRQYRDDRSDAVADSMRDERNTSQMLSARGLGFSGESAQMKLNSNIALAGRLGELAKKKSSDSLDLDLGLAEEETKLGIEHAEKLTELLKRKNELTLDIAKTELAKENADADRQAELDKLARELEFEKEQLELKLQAERESLKAKLDSEKLIAQMEIKSKADLLERELKAKYESGAGSSVSGNNSSSSSSSGSSGSAGNVDAGVEDKFDKYIPDIAAKELAKQLLSSTTDGQKAFSTDEHTYLVNRYLIDLIDNYGIDEDYYGDLVFALKAYGYTTHSYTDMKANVIGRDADEYYDKIYKETYNALIGAGVYEKDARTEAKQRAKSYKLDYISGRANDDSLFEKACREAGVAQTDIDKYLNTRKNIKENTSNKSGKKMLSALDRAMEYTY